MDIAKQHWRAPKKVPSTTPLGGEKGSHTSQKLHKFQIWELCCQAMGENNPKLIIIPFSVIFPLYSSRFVHSWSPGLTWTRPTVATPSHQSQQVLMNTARMHELLCEYIVLISST